MHKHRAFITSLLQNTDEGRRSQIRQATVSELCAVCEIVKNLLRNPTLRLKLKPAQRRILRRNREHLEKLIGREVSVDKKRRLLQRGGFLLPLIATLAVPILSRIFGGSE